MENEDSPFIAEMNSNSEQNGHRAPTSPSPIAQVRPENAFVKQEPHAEEQWIPPQNFVSFGPEHCIHTRSGFVVDRNSGMLIDPTSASFWRSSLDNELLVQAHRPQLAVYYRMHERLDGGWNWLAVHPSFQDGLPKKKVRLCSACLSCCLKSGSKQQLKEHHAEGTPCAQKQGRWIKAESVRLFLQDDAFYFITHTKSVDYEVMMKSQEHQEERMIREREEKKRIQMEEQRYIKQEEEEYPSIPKYGPDPNAFTIPARQIPAQQYHQTQPPQKQDHHDEPMEDFNDDQEDADSRDFDEDEMDLSVEEEETRYHKAYYHTREDPTADSFVDRPSGNAVHEPSPPSAEFRDQSSAPSGGSIHATDKAPQPSGTPAALYGKFRHVPGPIYGKFRHEPGPPSGTFTHQSTAASEVLKHESDSPTGEFFHGPSEQQHSPHPQPQPSPHPSPSPSLPVHSPPPPVEQSPSPPVEQSPLPPPPPPQPHPQFATSTELVEADGAHTPQGFHMPRAQMHHGLIPSSRLPLGYPYLALVNLVQQTIDGLTEVNAMNYDGTVADYVIGSLIHERRVSTTLLHALASPAWDLSNLVMDRKESFILDKESDLVMSDKDGWFALKLAVRQHVVNTAMWSISISSSTKLESVMRTSFVRKDQFEAKQLSFVDVCEIAVIYRSIVNAVITASANGIEVPPEREVGRFIGHVLEVVQCDQFSATAALSTQINAEIVDGSRFLQY